MKYIATEECCMFGELNPFIEARTKNGKLYAQCHQCLKHTCKVPVRVEK